MKLSFDYNHELQEQALEIYHAGVTITIEPRQDKVLVSVSGGDDGFEVKKFWSGRGGENTHYAITPKYKGGFDRT